MKKLSKEDLSLYHYLRHEVLSDFNEEEKSIPLEYLRDVSQSSGSAVYQAVSSMLPLPTSFGRGWVYLDSFGEFVEQTNSVKVYDSYGNLINGGYDIDYASGRLIFPDKSYNPKTVTYKWYYVALVDEWNNVQVSNTPVVAVEIRTTSKEGFQIGGGKKVDRNVIISVFASNRSEKHDLVETIYDGLYLKSCPLQNFPNSGLLDWDGRWNDNYVFETDSKDSYLKFSNVVSRAVFPRLVSVPTHDITQLSNLNKYRSKISFDMYHFEEA